MEEIWKEIDGYPSYEVSNRGSVRSYKKQVGVGKWETASTPQRTLKPSYNPKGYAGVGLCNNGVSAYMRVASLVMLTFVGDPPDEMEICHNDSNPRNNHLSNLRYDTHKANMEDWSRLCQARKAARFTEPQVMRIRTSIHEKKVTADDLASEFGVKKATIIRVCTGKTYQKYGGPIVEKMPVHHRKKTKRGYSNKYRGVTKRRYGHEAQIWIGGRGGKPLKLGVFSNEIDAARAYDKKAKELHGVFASLNFPGEQVEQSP